MCCCSLSTISILCFQPYTSVNENKNDIPDENGWLSNVKEKISFVFDFFTASHPSFCVNLFWMIYTFEALHCCVGLQLAINKISEVNQNFQAHRQMQPH